MLIKLFVTVVCPTLEYCNLVWGPLFVFDQMKIEKVQCRAIRSLSPFIGTNLMGEILDITVAIISLQTS